MGAAASEGREAVRAGLVSVAVGVAALARKAYAAWKTQSLALLADAAESVVNVVVALIATASASYAARPGEGETGFGHGKMEYLSASIEGAVVVVAAFVVAFESIARFGHLPQLPALGIGLAFALLATGANVALARFLAASGRRYHSYALLADALHLRSDVVLSLVVYAGVGLAWLTEWWRLDALLAIGVSLHILISGLRAVRQSMSGLVDERLADDELLAIERRLREEGPPVIGYRDLRTRRAGRQVFVELHLAISRYAMVYEAHEICDRIESDLDRLHPGVRVSIQIEPEGDPSPALDGPATG